ncbi:MAG: methyltransferase domain-containing protein [Nocardioidaceae bacterium]|nr:methyltransferase domain-containing protein [Nocardioidaceae bacterium]MCL2614593.1 methyltransferase domain-containing protein [Nocardioidaceae bacterium]
MASAQVSAPGSPRTAVVWDGLEQSLDGSKQIVDIGGGTGVSAVRLAEMGHHVSVVDPSPDALAALGRRAREAGVAVVGHQGDVERLAEVVGEESADVVLCHGVLEVVDPAAALASIRRVLRPGGLLSLLVAQTHAAVVAKAMAGQFQQARAILEDVESGDGSRGRRRFTRPELSALLADAGFAIDAVHGVRVFVDLVPGALVDQEAGGTAALLALERAVARREEYIPLAAQLHVLAR